MARTNWIPLALLVGAGVWAARRPEMVKARVHDALELAEDALDYGAETLERDLLPRARKALKNTERVATPLLTAAGEVASDLLERGGDVAQGALHWSGETAEELAGRGAVAAKVTKDWLGREIKGRGIAQKAGKIMEAKLMKELAMRLEKQEKAIHGLGRSLEHVGRPRRGGLPLGWMALLGGAYYLYRNPEVLHKALDAIKEYIPANATKHLEGAVDAVKDGAERISRGASPMDAAKDATAEAGSELGKAARDAKQQAGDAVKDMADKAGDAAKEAGRKAANA